MDVTFDITGLTDPQLAALRSALRRRIAEVAGRGPSPLLENLKGALTRAEQATPIRERSC